MQGTDHVRADGGQVLDALLDRVWEVSLVDGVCKQSQHVLHLSVGCILHPWPALSKVTFSPSKGCNQ